MRDLAFALDAISGSPTGMGATGHEAKARPAARDSSATPGSSRPRERIAWILVAALLAVIASLGYALVAMRSQPSPTRRVIRLASGARESAYHAIGTGIAQVLEQKVPSLEVRVLVTDGSFENMKLVDGGQAELALTQNDVAFHSVKTDRVLGHRSSNITALAVLFEEVAQIVVNKDAGIGRVTDLKGKAVGLGLPQSGMRFSSALLLEYFGIGMRDIRASLVDPTEGCKRVADGSLPAVIAWRAIPVPGCDDAFSSGRVRLLPLDPETLRGFCVRHPFLRLVTIPARVYPNQETDVSSIAVHAMLVSSRSLGDELVGKILETMFSSIPDLIAYHPRSSEISPKTAFQLESGLSIDLHPGARRFSESHPFVP